MRAIAYVFMGSSCRRVSAAILAPSHDGGHAELRSRARRLPARSPGPQRPPPSPGASPCRPPPLPSFLVGCIPPVQLRRTDLDTGEVNQILIPCGATPEAACPPCARRAQGLRAEQCRDGWHLEHELDAPPPSPYYEQGIWLTLRPPYGGPPFRPEPERSPST